LRKIPVSRTVKCPSTLKQLGIFASPLDQYFSQITLTNRIYLYIIVSFNLSSIFVIIMVIGVILVIMVILEIHETFIVNVMTIGMTIVILTLVM
jgi:hypothetical protein